MNFDNFVNVDYVLSFAGMIIIVNLLTQFTKRMFDKLLNQPKTKYVVYGWSFLLCAFAGAWTGKFTTGREIVETCLIWLINSVIVWFVAMKAFETVSTTNNKTKI